MATAKVKSSHGYDVHPGLATIQSVIAGMKQKSGRTIEEWIKLVEKEGPESEKERREWLKTRHGLGTNYAGWIAERSLGKGDDGNPETYLKQAEEYVEKMFSGPKAGLRPIYSELLNLGRKI